MNYEVIYENAYVKTIRLTYGVLINIYKSELRTNIGSYIKNKRKDIKKLDDKLYRLKVDITDMRERDTYHKDTLLYKWNSCCYYVIGDKLPKNQWTWEIKTTGDCLSGDTKTFTNIMKTIENIIEEEMEFN